MLVVTPVKLINLLPNKPTSCVVPRVLLPTCLPTNHHQTHIVTFPPPPGPSCSWQWIQPGREIQDKTALSVLRARYWYFYGLRQNLQHPTDLSPRRRHPILSSTTFSFFHFTYARNTYATRQDAGCPSFPVFYSRRQKNTSNIHFINYATDATTSAATPSSSARTIILVVTPDLDE